MTDNFNAGTMSSDDFEQFLDRLHKAAHEADTGNCVTLTGLTGDEFLDELGIK